ncbi:glycosyltransferase family 2 protein [Spirillospora sp. NPDC029432]|uniref:glycosyltransferase family 2 protein n=1 Tax=Spirillospora sp. NPDC029432 TaxID=3154599 RepID=UPI003455FDA2
MKVSVIVPVYNCREFLDGTFRSVFEQTLDGEEIELIAVDDGSTDGSGEYLDELAGRHPRLRVLHRPNTGGPGAPRNIGIEEARGEYVFFLDADDHLGPEALERMCAAADANGTGVVIGNYVGIGRSVARYDRSRPRVTLDDPDFDVFGSSLSAHKLYRRSLLVENGIRFPEGIRSGEDKVFAAHAYLHAGAVSIVADHDCYYLVARDSGTSIMQTGGAPAAEYYPQIALPLLQGVVAHTEPGLARDRMLFRLFSRDVLHRFGDGFLKDPVRRYETCKGARKACEDFMTPAVLERLPIHQRVIVHLLLEHQDELLHELVRRRAAGEIPRTVVDGDRAYAAYPGFRSPAAALPDAYFDVTGRLTVIRELARAEWSDGRLLLAGTARVKGAEEPGTAGVVLRHKQDGTEIALPGGGADGAFEVEFDPAALPSPGVWEFSVTVTIGAVTAAARLGVNRADGGEPAAPGARLVPAAGLVVTPFLSPKAKHLSVRAGSGDKFTRDVFTVDAVEWAGEGRLRLRGSLLMAAAGEPPAVSFRLAQRGGTDVRHAAVERSADAGRLAFDVVAGLQGCAPGRWDAWCEIGTGADAVRLRVPLPENAVLPAATGTGFGPARRGYEPYRTAKGALSVRVTGTPVTRRLKSALSRTVRAPLARVRGGRAR